MIKHISYSFLHLLACPYAAFLRYEAKLKGPTTEYLALGNALHLSLELAHKKGPFDKQIAINTFNKEYNRIIDDEEVFVGYPKRKKLEKEGLEMLALYTGGIDSGYLPNVARSLEKEFKLPFENIFVVGKIDRVDDLPDDDYSITDYKSGGKEPGTWFLRHNLQLTAYAWAGLELYGKMPAEIYWHHLRTGKRIRTERTFQDIEDLKQMIKNAIAMDGLGIRHRIFHEQICNWCTYKGSVCDDHELEERVASGLQ